MKKFFKNLPNYKWYRRLMGGPWALLVVDDILKWERIYWLRNEMFELEDGRTFWTTHSSVSRIEEYA